mmetsp:Transcript_3708/g.5449  ORF Transcript_3708/g.5449 Transcript_3708/m.5449 type:complete len:246 (+) Transcript_3708:71-808(+)
MMRSSSIISVLIVALLPVATLARGGGFLRDGFSSSIGERRDDSGLAMGMTQELHSVQKYDWQIDSFDLSSIEDTKLRTHISKILKDKPVLFRPQSQSVKAGGFRAVALTGEGKKLRGLWSGGTIGDDPTVSGDAYTEVDYDTAVRCRGEAHLASFSLLLPPAEGRKERATLEYTVPMGMGNLNPEAVIVRGPAQVKLYPDGNRITGKGIKVGTAKIGFPMRPGLVDPAWAKGRQFFRRGRSVGQV